MPLSGMWRPLPVTLALIGEQVLGLPPGVSPDPSARSAPASGSATTVSSASKSRGSTRESARSAARSRPARTAAASARTESLQRDGTPGLRRNNGVQLPAQPPSRSTHPLPQEIPDERWRVRLDQAARQQTIEFARVGTAAVGASRRAVSRSQTEEPGSRWRTAGLTGMRHALCRRALRAPIRFFRGTAQYSNPAIPPAGAPGSPQKLMASPRTMPPTARVDSQTGHCTYPHCKQVCDQVISPEHRGQPRVGAGP
jgi:hypothetical protein